MPQGPHRRTSLGVNCREMHGTVVVVTGSTTALGRTPYECGIFLWFNFSKVPRQSHQPSLFCIIEVSLCLVGASLTVDEGNGSQV
jgi:hypothetical protein